MSIPYHGSSAVLHGLSSDPDTLMVQVCPIDSSHQPDPNGQDLPPQIAALLSEFAAVFAPIDGLPPPRLFDHFIPLVPGAKPVFIRPYRYPPALKDEIEKQIQEMLDKGIIRPITSPFSSPLLLVKKKDGSWRPCVDTHNSWSISHSYF